METQDIDKIISLVKWARHDLETAKTLIPEDKEFENILDYIDYALTILLKTKYRLDILKNEMCE